MAQLHSKNIIHRDIKPSNILFTETKSYPVQIKLIDFGLAMFGLRLNKKTGMEGTPLFVAPEALDKICTNKSDIWSLGISSYFILTGEYPYNS